MSSTWSKKMIRCLNCLTLFHMHIYLFSEIRPMVVFFKEHKYTIELHCCRILPKRGEIHQVSICTQVMLSLHEFRNSHGCIVRTTPTATVVLASRSTKRPSGGHCA